MSENPYDQPESEVATTGGDGVLPIEQPRGRPIGHGWSWISEAWSLFTPAWGQWILALLLLMVIMGVLQIIPFGSLVGTLIAPVFGAGVLYMAHRARTEGRFEIADLFAVFQQRPGPLVGLGAIHLVVTMVIFGAVFGTMAATVGMQASEIEPNNEQAAYETMMALFTGGGALFGLIALALLMVWMAAYWFAVPLVYFGEYGIVTALKTSLIACLRNILPLLWYSIIVLVLAMVATIPFGLGWLVLVPVLMIAYYTMFRDIFSPDS